MSVCTKIAKLLRKQDFGAIYNLNKCSCFNAQLPMLEEVIKQRKTILQEENHTNSNDMQSNIIWAMGTSIFGVATWNPGLIICSIFFSGMAISISRKMDELEVKLKKMDEHQDKFSALNCSKYTCVTDIETKV
jgi:hypothetical protein